MGGQGLFAFCKHWFRGRCADPIREAKFSDEDGYSLSVKHSSFFRGGNDAGWEVFSLLFLSFFFALETMIN